MTSTASEPLLRLARETIRGLRASAASGGGVDLLRDCGHAGGISLYDAFAQSLREDGHPDPAEMTLGEFANRAELFFRKAGWGKVRFRSAEDALAIVDIEGGWEVADAGREGGCHVTTGALAGFLEPLADYPVAIMEVECAREGGAVCRFLAGNQDMLDEAYARVVAGEGWESVAQPPSEG